MSIKDKAMLVQLNIRQWNAERHDKAVTAQAEADFNAKNAGRFNKYLVPKESLEKIRKIGTRTRDEHYKLTLAWGDNGDRLLPSKGYMDYTAKIRATKSEFEQAVEEFLNVYPQLVVDARQRLGNMYDPTEYPDVKFIRRKFAIETSFFPLPDAADFRVDITDKEREKIRSEITNTVHSRQQAAVNECWNRLRDVVGKIHQRLSDPKAVFRDSLIENAHLLVELLPKLNFTEDEHLDHVRDLVQEHLLVPPQRLRDDPGLRAYVAERAGWILGHTEMTERIAA